jgi:hypothetical protein
MGSISAVLTLAVVILIPLAEGCSATERARSMSLNKYGQYHVAQYSGGKLVGEWDTTARPESEGHSDGFNFVDQKTGELIMVCGDLQVTEKK